MENRKNTILLTVIAVATLLVAVVGATFAYFTAQGNTSANKAVTVTTHTTDSATFEITGDLTLTASETNFNKTDKADVFKTATATAMFKASTAEAADMCYNVELVVTTNELKKCSGDTVVDGTRQLCSANDAVTDKDAAELVFTAKKGEEVLVNKADITVGTTGVKVPVSTTDATNYEHKISATAGNSVTDNWEFEVRLVNLDHDQQYNTNKSFAGSLKFTQVECA